MIDHINSNRLDNRIENLRWANQSIQERNKTNVKGYYLDRRRNKWYAKITIDGREKFLGYFETKEEARAAYVGAHNLLFGDICMKS